MPKAVPARLLVENAGISLTKALARAESDNVRQEIVDELRASLFRCTLASIWFIAPAEMENAESLGRKRSTPHKAPPEPQTIAKPTLTTPPTKAS
jgi:hypothetical protein